MHFTALLVCLGACGSAFVYGCDEVSSIDQLVHGMIERELNILRGSGELCYLGMKSYLIPNSSISASSFWGDQQRYRPSHARLDNDENGHESTGAWSSGDNTAGEWLQVDFGRVKPIAGVITQGRPKYHNQWVSTYEISCGPDENTLSTVVEEGGDNKVFTGNSDMETKKYNQFPEVLHCKIIRIYPQTWNHHMSLRAEFVHGACFNNPNLP